MTTILSIDGSVDLSVPQTDALGLPLPQSEVATTVLPVANDLPERSVPAAYESLIREPLRENAVLGAALQSLVEQLEPSVKASVVDPMKDAGVDVPLRSGGWESGQHRTRDAVVPQLVVARNLRGDDAPVVVDRGGVVRVANDVEAVSVTETVSNPRDPGRAGVPPPAADGGGTPSLPDSSAPSLVSETVVVRPGDVTAPRVEAVPGTASETVVVQQGDVTAPRVEAVPGTVSETVVVRPGNVTAPRSEAVSGTVPETVVGPKTGGAETIEDADGEGERVVSEEPEAPTAVPFAPVGAQVAGVREVAAVAEIAPVAAASRAAETSRASAVLVEIAAEVADTLLVTPGLLGGQGEIRVQLKPDVLSGTEVKIAVTGREMSVEFSPTVHETAVFIERNLPQLTQVLASRISVFNVSVSVRSDMGRDKSRA